MGNKEKELGGKSLFIFHISGMEHSLEWSNLLLGPNPNRGNGVVLESLKGARIFQKLQWQKFCSGRQSLVQYESPLQWRYRNVTDTDKILDGKLFCLRTYRELFVEREAQSIWLKESHAFILACLLGTRTEPFSGTRLRTWHSKSPGAQRGASKKKITEGPAEKPLSSLAVTAISGWGSFFYL